MNLELLDRHLRHVVENAPIAMWAINREGVLTLSTGGALAGLGLKPGQIIGENAFDVYKDSPEVIHSLKRGLAGEGFTEQINVAGRVFDTRYFPLTDDQGNVIGLQGVSMDITERYHAEIQRQRGQEQLLQAQRLESERGEQLRKQKEILLHLALRDELHEADLKKALEIICDAAGNHLQVERTSIWIYKKDNTGILCLNLYEREKGKHSEGAELLESEYPAYFQALAHERAIDAHDAHTDPRTREFSKSYLSPQGITSMLDAPIRGGGRMLGVLCHEHVGPARIWRREEQGFAGSIGDLVASVLAADERRRMQHQLLQAQKLESVGLLAGGIAHDFNNLLTSILGGASNALVELPPDHKSRASVENVVLAARRAAGLTRQLLAYSGKGSYEIKPINISKMVTEIGTLLTTAIPKNVELKNKTQKNLPNIEADEVQVQQVLMNLIINGAEAIGEEKGSVAVSTGVQELTEPMMTSLLETGSITPGSYVYIEIVDSGCGMTEETLSKIFDPFFSTKLAGRGLGLAAVIGIVRSQKGGIQVQSKPNEGTKFRVFFPVSDAKSLNEEEEILDFRGKGLVLLVDDDHAVRLVVRQMFERFGFTVVEAENGRVGVNLLLKHEKEVCLVLLDLAMPVLSGEEAFREMRQLSPELPIIFTSGFDETEATRRFVSEDVTRFLQKPFNSHDLAGKLSLLLDKPTPIE